MKSLTIWHSKNNLKGHLDTEEMVKKTADCKELLKQSRKSPQNKQRKVQSQQDRLNVVMFRNSVQLDAGLESKAKEIVEFSDSRHKETKELKNDRGSTNNPSLDNSVTHPALAKLANSKIESENPTAEIHSVATLTGEESESLSNVLDAEHETSECPPNIMLGGCNDNEIHVQDSEKETCDPVACIASDIDTEKILNSEEKTVNSENHKMPVLEKENNSTSAKFHCSQCNFRTKYKNFWKLHKHVHMSKDSVTCDMCNIMFSSKKSMVVWHAKNGLQEHVFLLTIPKVNRVRSKMKIRSNPLKKHIKSQVKQNSFQMKSQRNGQLGTDLNNIDTDIALDLSIIKEEPNEAGVEMFDNQESSGYPADKCNIAGTCKGHHVAGLDKVYFNTHIDSLYCDDLVSNADSHQRKSDFPEEIRMAISRTESDDSIADGNINDSNNGFRDRFTNCSATERDTIGLDINELSDKITNESVDDGSKNGNVNDTNDRDTGDNVQDGKSSNDKDLNNNELGGNGCESNGNSEFRDENNNMNKESGDDGDENDEFRNENIGSPKHVELLICLVCQTSFSSKVLLIKHLVKVHNLTNLCRLCYFKDYEIKKFANPVSLRNHRLRCHENEMKPCVCGSLFLDYHTLASHLKKFKCTQKEHPDLHKCICGKRFTSEKELNSHKFLKCRKRKLTKSDNKGHNSKINRTDRTESECVSESAGTETLDFVKEWPSQNVKPKKKRKAMKDIRNANSISENIGEGNGLNKDLNNNVVDDFIPMEHKENALNVKNENRRVKCKESKFPMNKNMTVHRTLRENKKNVCKACFARFKPCDCFYHQKVCHQKRTGTDSMRKSGLRSGKEITI